MYPAVIDSYDAPTSVQEALQAFAQRGNDCHFIAGGQSLMQAIKARVISPKSLIDLQHVAELNGIEYKQGAVRIGAMTGIGILPPTSASMAHFRHFAMPRAMSAIVKCAIAARSGAAFAGIISPRYAPDLHWYRSVAGSRQQNWQAVAARGRVFAGPA